MNIILFGPPGAGKGTQSKYLVHILKNFQVSTGDILKEEIKKNSAIGQQITINMNEGKFVSDKIVNGLIEKIPLIDQVAAVSCGIYNGHTLLDLDYDEDSDAGVDANFVLTGANKIIEVQATAEDKAFDKSEFNDLLQLAESGISQLGKLQKTALGIE